MGGAAAVEAHCCSGGALRAVAVALPAPRAAPPPSPPPSPPRAPSERSLHAGGRGEVGKGADRRAWGVWRDPGGAIQGRPDPAIGMARFRRSWGVWRRPGGCVRGGNDGDARRPIGVGRRESASVGVNRRRSAWIGVGRRGSAQRSDEQCRRCGGARAVRGGCGGVKAGWRRPDRRTGAPGSSVGGGAGGPPHAGDGGEVGKGADRRAWGVWRGPGGAGGCHPLAGI